MEGVMKKVCSIFGLLVLTFLTVSCSTSDKQFRDFYSDETPQLVFNHPTIEFERTEAQIARAGAGFSEFGNWRNKPGYTASYVWIQFTKAGYQKVFSSKSVGSIEDTIRQMYSNFEVKLKNSDSFNTRYGAVDVQYFLTNDFPCVYLRYYWTEGASDPNSIIVGGGVNAEKLGDNGLAVGFCQERKGSMSEFDVQNLLRAVSGDSLGWPADLFEKVN